MASLRLFFSHRIFNTYFADLACTLNITQTGLKQATCIRFASKFNDEKAKPKQHISRYPVPDVRTLPSDMQKLIDEAKEKAGFVPNVFQTLSHRPKEMQAFVNYYDAVMEDRTGGHLTKADKEMIVVAVSAYNKCRYCIIAHSALFRIYSKNRILADQIAANWQTADIDDRQRSILNFALQVTKCEPLSETHFDALRQHGLDEEDAWDIGSVVALFSLSNRMAYLTSMVPNEEFYMLGRVPKEKK
ncbi:uncharacterized protein LOC131958343 [Physella acuta]|uniref:uncharacterized protein LOC131958343 n=1 Tax=Physella acuta TaxID=109671 RepID=UPI0027DC822C|nr:uncharacterized protein LOC131958343 [Physella acuta]